MAFDTLKLSEKFASTIYTWDGWEPELTLEFEGYSEEDSLDLTVEQAKKLVEQLQQFIYLSEESASESA